MAALAEAQALGVARSVVDAAAMAEHATAIAVSEEERAAAGVVESAAAAGTGESTRRTVDSIFGVDDGEQWKAFSASEALAREADPAWERPRRSTASC